MRRSTRLKSVIAATLMLLLLSSFTASFGYLSSAAASEARVLNTSEGLSAASGLNRFVVWQDDTPGNSEIFFRRSLDNGATWQTTKNLSNNAGPSGTPRIAVSGSIVYIAWLQLNTDSTKADILLMRSLNNGATWGAKVKITPGGTCNTANPCHQFALLSASGTNLYLVTLKTGDIFLTRSSDNGVTWKTPINVSSNAGLSDDPIMAISGNNVYLAWSQSNAAHTSIDILFRRSTDNGATWKSKVNLSNSGQGGAGEMAISGSNIHVVWQENSQVFIRSSTDSGATWKAVKQLTNTPTEWIDGPAVAASGSRAYVLYANHADANQISTASCGGEFEIDLVFLASADNGATWKPPVSLLETFDGCGHVSLSPYILASGSNVYTVWRIGTLSSGGSAFRSSTDNGVTWGDTIPIHSATGNGPILVTAAAGSNLYIVVWSRGEVYFLRSIDSGETVGPKLNLSNNSGRSTNPQIGI